MAIQVMSLDLSKPTIKVQKPEKGDTTMLGYGGNTGMMGMMGGMGRGGRGGMGGMMEGMEGGMGGMAGGMGGMGRGGMMGGGGGKETTVRAGRSVSTSEGHRVRRNGCAAPKQVNALP
jgi:hypothetical protein